VFRPSTGEWFTFDDWSRDAISTVELISNPSETVDGLVDGLMVAIDDHGCASPSL